MFVPNSRQVAKFDTIQFFIYLCAQLKAVAYYRDSRMQTTKEKLKDKTI